MKTASSNQAIAWFYQRFREDALELSPTFQRNPVWLQHQKEYLIETILLELPLPEIYLVNRITPDGTSRFIVVDGQQRLRAILSFITGELEIRSSLEHFPNLRVFNNLSDHEKQRFFRYNIVVRDLEDSSDQEIRNLFVRLNRFNVELNEQELRNARFKGHFLQTVQAIADDEFWAGSGIFSLNEVRRMLDLEFISVLLGTLIGGIFGRKERVDEFYEMYEDEFEASAYYIDKFGMNLDVIDILVPNIKKTRWRNKADFFTLFLCIDDLGLHRDDIEVLERVRERLNRFDTEVQRARNEPEAVEPRFQDYLLAITVATNEKDSRVRRLRILRDYLAPVLQSQENEINVTSERIELRP